jgi:glycosyltransferase involved in cell wall biosynthesis
VRQPRVSIICIFYNAQQFLREALDSIMAQDFEGFELLLVDDGSFDESTAIAREYAAAFPGKIRYLEHDGHQNRGMSASRNLGIASSNGEFIAFIDADDVWRPHKLREQVRLLDANPRVDMICGSVNYWRSWEGGQDRITPTGHVVDRISTPPAALLAVYPLGIADAPCPSDVMLRRSAVELVGGFEDDFTGFYEDVAFFAKLFLRCPVWFSSRVWLDYRLHGASCSSAVTPERYREVRRRFLDWFMGYIDGLALPEKRTIERAVRQARWELDHPAVGRFVRRLRRMAWLGRSARIPRKRPNALAMP